MTSRRITLSRENGFTLLEVLVALVIVAIGLGTVLTVTNDALYQTGQIQDNIIAQWVAENTASRYRLNRSRIGLANQSARVRLLNKEWLVKTSFSNTPDPYVKKMDVRVFLAGEPTRQIVQLTSFVVNNAR